MPPHNLPSMRRKLLRWYDSHHRDLPWRRTRDPYAIWIAETMLQQTQVGTVVPYYERFLRALPTVGALARAPLRRVLALWSGLGYYRRAENLKKSARLLLRKYAGRLPDDYASLLALPGVGDYTAGALMSIAFGKPYPALDGNARRVLGRLFNPQSEKELREIANHLVPISRPGYFNQGLMELGATTCVSQKPRCVACPVASSCATRTGHRSGKKAAMPGKAMREVVWPLALVRRGGEILLRRRGANGILAGLWELPGGEKTRGESLQAFLARHLGGLNGSVTRPVRVGALRHAITTRKIRAPIFLFAVRPGARLRLKRSEWRWVSRSALWRYPVSSMTLKAAAILASYEKAPR